MIPKSGNRFSDQITLRLIYDDFFFRFAFAGG
jgi:hypothetical protein